MDDTLLVIVNETLIQDAVLRASPETLDGVLDAYRPIAHALPQPGNLVRTPGMETQRHGSWNVPSSARTNSPHPWSPAASRTCSIRACMQYGHFVLTMKW